MANAKRVEVTLLGQTLTIRTDATAEYVRELADYLEQRVEAIRRSGVQDQSRALVLAALDLTDELFRAREDRERHGDLGARLGALASLLERATPKA
ncbi:MAG: cell division protein ZapA [Candidatus Rokubacteria bacterium]|nr:cell division protein ZapA [Candidatus Rokubacteria bacterium]